MIHVKPEAAAPLIALDPALVERVANLQSTADYITCLAEIVRDMVNGLRKACPPPINELSDWYQAFTLLSLIGDQSAIAMAVAEDVDRADMATRRA